MKYKDIYIEFERRLQVMFPDMILDNKPSSDLILQYLNDGLNRLVTTRFTGLNYKRLGFEQDQKRIDDLKFLVKEQSFDVDVTNTITLPNDYLHLLGETAYISSADKCWPKEGNKPLIKQTDVIEATVENIDSKLANSLSEHNLHGNRAKPIRLIKGNKIHLYTDGKYIVEQYKITYLKKPTTFTLDNPMYEYEDLPDYVINEIINLAISIYLADKGDNRYQLAQNEVAQME